MGSSNTARQRTPRLKRKWEGSYPIRCPNQQNRSPVDAVASSPPKVSPPWVTETLEELGWDTSIGLPAARVAPAYVECVEGTRNGETLDARLFA